MSSFNPPPQLEPVQPLIKTGMNMRRGQKGQQKKGKCSIACMKPRHFIEKQTHAKPNKDNAKSDLTEPSANLLPTGEEPIRSGNHSFKRLLSFLGQGIHCKSVHLNGFMLFGQLPSFLTFPGLHCPYPTPLV